MKLQTLHIENFKSIPQKTITFGQHTAITGGNGTGKTTIQDAYTWLFFDRDSADSTGFSATPLDQNGHPKREQTTAVTATITCQDGTEHTYSRSERHSQNGDGTWKTSSAYAIDDCPVTKKAFVEHIGTQIDPTLFKLASVPTYFSKLHWSDQRAQLSRLAPPISAAELSKQYPDHRELIPAALGNSAIDHKAGIQKKIKTLKKTVEEYRAFLTAYPDTPSVESEYLQCQTEIDNIKRRIETIETERNTQIAHIQADMEHLTDLGKQSPETQLEDLQHKIDTQLQGIAALQTRAEACIQILESLERERKHHQTEWKAQNEQKNETIRIAKQGTIHCPTCGQTISRAENPEIHKAAMQHLLNDIERAETSMKTIEEKGKATAHNIDKTRRELETYTAQIADEQKELSALETQKQALETQIPERETTQLGKLSLRLKLLQTPPEELTELRETLETTIGKREELIRCIKTQKRRKETQTQLDQTYLKLSEQERNLFILGEMEETIAQHQEKAINTLFPSMRVRLFEILQNQETKPCCKLLIQTPESLVDFQSANYGAQVRACTEVVSKLTDGIDIPLWIDGYESVELDIPQNRQTITMTVEKEQPLRIQTTQERKTS